MAPGMNMMRSQVKASTQGYSLSKKLDFDATDSDDMMDFFPDPKDSESDSNSEFKPELQFKLNFNDMSTSDTESDVADMESAPESDSVFKLKTLKLRFDDMGTSDSELDVSDNLFVKSSTELRNLDGFDTAMSPIVHKQSRGKSVLMSRKRQKRSNRANSTAIFETPERHGYTNSHRYSPEQSPSFSRRKPTRVTPMSSFQTTERRGKFQTKPYSPVVKRQKRQHITSLSSATGHWDSEDSGRCSLSELCVSDLSISRYTKEFLHKRELASGAYGRVELAQHRLDNKFYAIKVNKEKVKPKSSDEKKLLKEVSAHAKLNSSKHVVRYFNSWVEEGHVYIQNEFCNGGSFTEMINKRRKSGEHFSEDELKTVFTHSLKGLKYIHKNKMAHMDIKPDNILVRLDLSSPCTCERTNVSNDSGAESDDPCSLMTKMDLKESQACEEIQTTFKIADFGHTRYVKDNNEITDGDCRYMAPELLYSMSPDTSAVQKADIFSLGCSLYEAASLRTLPKNSEDEEGSLYLEIRKGKLPYLENYSKKFNDILGSMITEEPQDRPTALKLLKQIRKL